MSPEIEKTIGLIKRSYNQPIFFHLLYSHLSYLLSKTTPIYEITDDWSKILIFSCHSNNTPNQGLEIKIQQNLKRYRPPFDDEKKLKTMVICYYLLNRPSNLINHIIVFELISGFLGVSSYFDGLILRIFSNMLLSKVFDQCENKKLREESINRIQEIIKTKELSEINRIRSLICFITGNIIPFKLDFVTITPTFQSYKTLEAICLYAKYTQDTSFIKEILPTDLLFIEGLESFLKFNFSFETSDLIPPEKCCLTDRSIFEKIKQEFMKSNDKKKFVSELIDFISSLK